MDEAQEVIGVALVADDQAPEVGEPGEEAFDLPAATIAPEFAPVLRFGLGAVAAVWGDQVDALGGKVGIEWVRIIRLIADQALRHRADKAGVENRLDERDLVRRSGGGTCGERKTSAVCHCHELRTFAPLGRTDGWPPFLAATKVPSMKHSDRSSPPRSRRSSANACSTLASVPSRTQAWKRRWQVWYGGYRSGRSCHGAPVRSTQSTPFSTVRVSRHGRPRPSARRGGSPITGLTTVHCSSVKSTAVSSSDTAYRFMR